MHPAIQRALPTIGRDSALGQALVEIAHDLDQLMGSVTPPGTGGGPATLLWVCNENGNDGTGTRGDIAKPYKTVQAAVTAAQSGDTVLVAPGIYAETVTVPPALTQLGLAGTQPGAAIEAPAGSALIYTPSGSGNFLTLDNLRIDGDGTAPAVVVTATAANVTTLAVTDCNLLGLTAIKCKLCTILDTTVEAVAATFNENASLFVSGCSLLNGLTVSYDVTASPATPRRPSVFHACEIQQGSGTSTILFEGAPFFFSEALTVFAVSVGIVCSNLVGDAANGPVIQVAGWISGENILTAAPLAAGYIPAQFDFSRSTIVSDCDVGPAAEDPFGRTRFTAYGASFSGHVTAMFSCDADIRESRFRQSLLGVTGTGTIDRSTHQLLAQPVPGGATVVINIIPPFPDASFQVALTEVISPTIGVGNPAKTASSVSVAANPSATPTSVDLTLLRISS